MSRFGERFVAWMDRLTSVVNFSSRSIAIASGVVAALMMGLVAANVISRETFNEPVPGTVEIVRVMMVFLVFLPWALVQVRKGHIQVTFLHTRVSPRTTLRARARRPARHVHLGRYADMALRRVLVEGMVGEGRLCRPCLHPGVARAMGNYGRSFHLLSRRPLRHLAHGAALPSRPIRDPGGTRETRGTRAGAPCLTSRLATSASPSPSS